MTPGHCQHRSVSAMIGEGGESKRASGGRAMGAAAYCRLQLLHGVGFLCHEVSADKRANEWRTGSTVCSLLNWLQTGRMCPEVHHALLPWSIHHSDFTSAPVEESSFGSKRAATPALLKETWCSSPATLGSKALHLQD